VEADYVDAGGARLLVRRWGSASRPNVLYWHGGGGGSQEFPHIAPALEAAGYSVYAPDAPGYGDSPPLTPESYRASNVADIAAALIDVLGIAPVIWVGYSWGANIGVHTALQAPGRVEGLALLDGGYLVQEDDPDFDPNLDLEGQTAALRAEIEEAGESWDAPVEVMATAMLGSNEDPALPLLPQLEESGLPVLLVASTKPPEFEEVRARALARFRTALPSAEVVPVAAGHGIFTEAGDDVRRIVRDWLGRLA
jgi:pimeloyl-ACP methyl ester carboxylesterase